MKGMSEATDAHDIREAPDVFLPKGYEEPGDSLTERLVRTVPTPSVPLSAPAADAVSAGGSAGRAVSPVPASDRWWRVAAATGLVCLVPAMVACWMHVVGSCGPRICDPQPQWMLTTAWWSWWTAIPALAAASFVPRTSSLCRRLRPPLALAGLLAMALMTAALLGSVRYR
jgi:hypothetical protein